MKQSHSPRRQTDFTISFQPVLQISMLLGISRSSPSDSSDLEIIVEELCQLKYAVFQCKGMKCIETGSS